ncbi:TonB family protein [Prosthecobacter sp.]|uniref:energy transducer TonB n=1 Tax=Prosthecobacter sp. TaxID=1965333 RepID=UPI002AB8B86D|nr:TonB family protein [Prosthecobacter sp.]MDZ4406160.1 TonB family protein [Prosthecobacter sp.]
MGLDLAMPNVSSAAAARPAIWRRRSTLQALITLSWIVGITASFLAVGIVGMFAADLPPIHLKSLEADIAADQAMIEASMAELQTLEANEVAAEEEPVLPVEIPEAVETPPENLDLPEIAEAMTMEDIFAIPTAPKIEDALRPVDPVAKPKPAPPRPRTQAVARSSGTPSTTSRSGVVGGSAGGTANGVGTKPLRSPKPPYPSFARNAGMQGTVLLSISVGPSGAVESATVIGSSGFSALDEPTASWVRRNWRWPVGATGRYSQPIRFKID